MIKQLVKWVDMNELGILLIHKLPHEHTNYLNWILPIIWSQSSAFTQQIDECWNTGIPFRFVFFIFFYRPFRVKKSTASQRERECKNTNSY